MTHRIERVNNLIRDEISQMLQRQVKDPRLGAFVMVTDVRTTPDLKHARVFVSQVSAGEDRKQILSALASAAGFFRTELSRRLRLRYVPELTFEWDDSIERGARILQIMDRLEEEKKEPPPAATA